MEKVIDWIKKEWHETRLLLKNVPALLMTFFVLSLVMMNLLANKSIDLNASWIALDAGIVVSWLAFLTMDILVKRFGPRASTRLTIVATVINLLVTFIFMLGAKVAGTWGEAFVEDGQVINDALNNTFAGTWYVLLGSTVAFIVSAVVNNVLNWSLGKLFKKNPDGFLAYAVRSYGSTMVAQFIDNFVFSLIVSLNFFGWSFLQCFTCALVGALVELVCEIIFSPIGYVISKRWAEQGVGQEYLDYMNSLNNAASLVEKNNINNHTSKKQQAKTSETDANKEV